MLDVGRGGREMGKLVVREAEHRAGAGPAVFAPSWMADMATWAAETLAGSSADPSSLAPTAFGRRLRCRRSPASRQRAM